MLDHGPTGFLLADGRRARLLIEPTRGAQLTEAWSLEIGPEDLYQPQDRPARAHDSSGPHRHAMDGGRNLHEAEEEKFLHRVAARLDADDKRGVLDHLVIAAPPRALGLLRQALSASLTRKLKAETAKDLLSEDVAVLRARLHELLR